MADTPADPILTILQQRGAVTADQLAAVTERVARGSALKDAVLEVGGIDEEAFTQAYAESLNMPYVNLQSSQIARDVLTIIPQSTAREHAIIAFNDSAQELQVAMADPSDRQIVEFIRKKVDKPVVVGLASDTSIRTGLAQYQESLESELQDVIGTVGAVTADSQADLSKAAEDLPIIRLVDLILRHAIVQSASDIHIEPTETQVVVRFRKDGILYDMLMLPHEYVPGLVARIKVLANLKIDEHRLPQDGRFKIESDDYKVAFRVSILPVYDGEKIVMRLLDESGRGLTLDSMGMTPATLETFRRNIDKPHGMVLVTGPTGSGKTTTLYAAMRELNTPEVNISTIEDPIEYRMPRINQTQVNAKIGLTFANGLRSLVRQDPDILMVGEIRDEETASLAVNASLTGHLVLSTLHTNSAAGALPRLLDMNVESFLVASTVNLFVAQRLVRRLCPECRQEGTLSKDALRDLKKVMDVELLTQTLRSQEALAAASDISSLKVYKAGECLECSNGYKGRIGIYEVLEFTDEIRSLVKSNTTSGDLEAAARQQQGMVTMIEDGFIKISQGVTSVEEVLRVAKE